MTLPKLVFSPMATRYQKKNELVQVKIEDPRIVKA
jgi:hypothetical protein